MKEIIFDLAAIGMALALIAIWYVINIMGMYGGEASAVVYWLEVSFYALILILGLERLYDDWIKK